MAEPTYSDVVEHGHPVGPDGLPFIWHVFGNDGLSQRFLLLAKMIERVAAADLQNEFGISVAQWRVLAFVCMSGPATASFMGEAAEADQAEISRAVKALIDKGLVTRDFQPGSRKTLIIAPTAAGSRQFAAIRKRRQAYFSQIMGKLDAEQKQAFNSILIDIATEVVADRERPGRQP